MFPLYFMGGVTIWEGPKDFRATKRFQGKGLSPEELNKGIKVFKLETQGAYNYGQREPAGLDQGCERKLI